MNKLFVSIFTMLSVLLVMTGCASNSPIATNVSGGENNITQSTNITSSQSVNNNSQIDITNKQQNDISTENSNLKDVSYIMYFQSLVKGDGGAYYNSKNYFIDIHNLKSGYDLSSIIENKIGKDNFQKLAGISYDAGKALIYTYNEGDERIKDEIIDCNSKKVIFTYEYSNLGDNNYNYYSPSLDVYISVVNNELYFNKIDNSIKRSLSLTADNINLQNIVFSPDEKRIAYISNSDKNIKIYTFDLDSLSARDIISFPDGYIQLSQWHVTDKLVYNRNSEVNIIDIKSKNIVDIGKYMFFPSLSPDGIYLVYSRPSYDFVYDYCSDQEISKYEGRHEYGLFVLNIETGDVTKINISKSENQIPISWIKE